MKKDNHLKTFHRVLGIRKLGTFYLCHNCREQFLLRDNEKIKCPTCGNEKREIDFD